MTDDVTRMLQGALPVDPDPTDWGPAARRRSTSRRTAQIAVAAALAVAVVVPTTYLALRDGGQAVPAETVTAKPTGEPTSEPAPVPVGDTNPCTDIRAEGATLTPIGEGLPDGATRAWLCGDETQAGPAEALSDPTAVVEAINALQPADLAAVCTEEYRLTYHLVIDYAAERRIVAGALHGCQAVDDGQRTYQGGQELYQAAIDAWTAQRAASDAQAEPVTAAAPCSAPVTLIPAQPGSLGQGWVCDDASGADPLPIPADLVQAVADSLQVVERDTGTVAEPLPGQFIFVDAWGSHLTLQASAYRGFARWGGPLEDQSYVEMAPEAEAALRALLPESPMFECGDGAQAGVAEIKDIMTVLACSPDVDGPTMGAPLDPELAMQMVESITGNAELLGAGLTPELSGPFLEAQRTDGVVYTLAMGRDAGALYWQGEEGEWHTWAPDDDMLQRINDYFPAG